MRTWRFLALALAALAAASLADAADAEGWLAWERLNDGHQNRIYLRGNDPVETLASTRYQVRSDYPQTVRVELLVVNQGDGPATPATPRRVVRATLQAGQVGEFGTSGGEGVSFRRLVFLGR
jgi:hypothetical protein